MPTIHRLTRRFFTVLISLSLAVLLPRTALAGGSVKSPGPTLCQISDTVYRADGTPAQGTVLVSWQAFTTSGGQAVTPGSLLVTLDGNGGFNAGLAPNTGASPAGTYYKAIFKLNDGTTETEYWVVPDTQSTTIGAIRSKLVPAQQAAQFLTRDFADSNYVNLASTQTISGVKSFSASPAVPTPQNASDAANKSYVDANAGSSQLLAQANTWTGKQTFNLSPAVPTPQNASDATNKSYVDANAGSQLLAQANTWAGKQTFNLSPAVPTPQNATDAANKSYVDANAGGNLSSPPPIGNVVPNTVAATVLIAQNVNGVVNAASYPGADWSVATNAAIAAAPSGGTVDMRAFTAGQIAVPGSQTITLPKAIHLLLPSGSLTFSASPGINITSYNGVILEGQGWQYNFEPSASPLGTILTSGNTGILIQDNTSQGSQLINLELNGNSKTGLVGYFCSGCGGPLLHNVHAHDFAYVGLMPLAFGTTFTGHTMSNDNGSDGIVTAIETKMEGEHQTYKNGGNCYHFLGGSGRILHPVTGQCGLHGIYVDARKGDTGANSWAWVANHNYISPTLIQPNSGNPGNYYFFSLNVNVTSAGSAPAWCQTTGCIVSDGTVKWINAGTNLGPFVGSIEHLNLLDADSEQNGTAVIAGFKADNIRYEGSGSGARSCQYSAITQAVVNQAGTSVGNVNGLHLLNCQYMEVTDYTYLGAGQSYSGTLTSDYGLLLENTEETSVKGYNTVWGGRSAIKEINTLNVTISSATLNGTGQAATLSPDNYAVQIDANSANAKFNDLTVSQFPSDTNQYGVYNLGSGTTLDNYRKTPLTLPSPIVDSLGYAILSNAYGRQANVPLEFDVNGSPALTIDGNAKVTLAGALAFQNIPGVEFLVSKYASIQAAINAAYNNGAVLGTVIDDRTSPYSGPGFILYDSVTLQLAATTYTITSTVTYNNGNNNVTAGIIAVPGARLVGASTSTNHGTIITAGNGLNADLIATSTVGTGIGGAAQWWHWGGFENLRVTGNGANQTAGNCFNIENMGETAFLRTIEVSGCKLDNILFTGASATPSDIANITTNSAGRYGFNFNNLSGLAVVHGLSGDSNATSLVRLNGGQSGTLTILGFKAEEEVSGQDPLITIDETGQSGSQPSLFIVGGYTFGRAGLNDIIKYVNGTTGTAPYISVSNFYTQNYVNAVNDTVNNRTTAAANMNKVPFYYGPTGAFYSGQAYTLDLNTFVQSPHSGNNILTEVFGTTSSNETLVAASGTSTDISVGGIGFRMPNRSVYGQSPELFAKMTYAFPGGNPNTQQWEFIPAKVGADNSTRWIGDPSYRWDEIYSADVNTTTATIGTLNVTTCVGCGPHLVTGTMQGNTATLTGNSTDLAIYTATLPAGTFGVGTGAHCWAKWQHTTSGSTAITYKWILGAATVAYGSFTSASQNLTSDVEVLTPSALTSQIINASPVIAGTAIQAGPLNGNAGSENLANSDTLKLTFNAGSGEQVKGVTFYCQTVQ